MLSQPSSVENKDIDKTDEESLSLTDARVATLLPAKSNLQPQALSVLAALAQTSRLQAFRLLSASGEAGIGAGTIAKTLGIPHNTLSTHLAILQRAGLIDSTREGRNVTYYIVPESLGSVISFLLQDCCVAVPEKYFPAHFRSAEGASSFP